MLKIADRTFRSRLFLGTGKFSSAETLKKTIEASGSEMITVALRRIDLNDPADDIMNVLDLQKYLFLPNTSGARDAREAVRLARLARAAGSGDWLKLEVTPDPRTLLPDPIETLKPQKNWSKMVLSSCPISMPTRSWPYVCRMQVRQRSCRLARPSAPTLD